MKASLSVITLLFIAIAIQISFVKSDKKLQLINETQKILNTGNPYCVFYRDVVNAYIKETLKELAPFKKCQLRCHNRDDEYAELFPNWYLPNNFPVDPKNCGEIVDDCSYKFDEDWMYGKNFLGKMYDAEVFLDFVMRKLFFCAK